MAEARNTAEAELAADVEIEKVVSAVELGLERKHESREREREEAEGRAHREEREARQREQAERTEEMRRSTA
jgi:hypothetical protein